MSRPSGLPSSPSWSTLNRMQKELRLKKAREFSHIYRQGRSWANDLLVLKAMPNGTDGRNRYGFSVSKRTGNAVVRNTIKRRTREAVRNTPTVGGWDMIFIARQGSRVRRTTTS